MNKAKNKKDKIGTFPIDLTKSWEDTDGVNFAVALARISGWLLHVDWWTTKNGEQPVEEMKSLRVYVGDDRDNIYDVRGKQKIQSFANKTIMPIAKQRGKGNGGILTRYYSEQKLFELPLRVKPDEARIVIADIAIRNNANFLEKIPIRLKPCVPAHLAANYTFGRCAIYATAMQDITNLPATAIIANRYSELFALSKIGYAHSIVLHPDGSAEDAWGRTSIENITGRYGIVDYTLNIKEHQKVNETLKKNSAEKYQIAYNEAVELINQFAIIRK